MPFVSDSGISIPAVTTAEMAEVDRIAIEETGPNLFQMMENAGRSLAQHVIGLGLPLGNGVAVFAGSGGNGGGGLTAGRHLAQRGVTVTAVVSDAAKLNGVVKAQFDLFLASGGVAQQAPPERPSVVIDALIGYSLRRGAPTGAVASLIETVGQIQGRGSTVVSLDVPSGVDATSGARPGVSVQPHSTVTLALPKTGLAGAGTGELVLADIGIPALVFERLGRAMPPGLFGDRWMTPIRWEADR